MNKYQEALDRIEETYYNLDNCLSAMKRFGKDVQTLSELVDKATPKKPNCISTKEFLYAMYSFEYLNQDKAPLSLDECIKYLERINE